MKLLFKHQNWIWVIFNPAIEVVDRGSETQPQVVKNLNKFTQQDKG